MKIKNINIFERHIEKIIVGVCVLAAVYFLYTYAISGSYKVEVSGVAKTPAEVEDDIRRAGKNLEANLRNATVPEQLQTLEVAPYAEDFRERFERPILADIATYEAPIGQPALDPKLLGTGQVLQNRSYAETKPPQPLNVRARADFGVLDVSPSSPTYDQLVSVVGDSQPMDVWYVSVQAMYNMGVWRQKQTSEPQDARVPGDWTRASSFVVDVVLERQTWDPYAGQWGPVETIDPIPSETNFRDLPQRPSKPEADRWIQTIQLQQDNLSKPPFAPMTPTRPWLPPDVVGRLTPAQVTRLREIDSEMADLRRQLDGEPSAAPVGPASGGGRGFDAQFDGADLSPAARRSMGIGRAPVATGDQSAPMSTKAIIDRMKSLNSEYLQLVGAKEADQDGDDPLAPQVIDQVKVWQHDMTVQPGMSYRYRIVVGLVNPLFQRIQLGNDQRRTQFFKLVRLSEPSAWTDPITIPEKKQFFVVASDPSRRVATVEVWTIFDGAWRTTKFEVQAGDPIGSVRQITSNRMEMDIDLNVDATVVDIDTAFPVRSQIGDTTTRMLYVDDVTGEMYSRTAHDDTVSVERRRLLGN